MASKLNLWRESASLILAAKSVFSKSSNYDYKVLCLKRSMKSKFMPDTYVFPGGNVSKSDSNLGWLNLYEKFGFSKQSFDNIQAAENIPKILQNDEKNTLPNYLSFRICAIRETFEECGILLCKSPKITTDTKWTSFVGGHEFISWQHKVHDNPDEFLNLCKHFEILPDVWGLKNWSNWLTPTTNKTAKFNTIFFIASLHQMPNAQKDKREIQDLMWTTPNEYIEMNNEQKILLPPPQFYEMSRLKTIKQVEELADFASNRTKFGFEPYWLYRIRTNEGVYSILPGDDLYPGEIDKNDSEMPEMIKLPGSQIKNRILHKSEYSNLIEIENFTPKCNHIIPSKK